MELLLASTSKYRQQLLARLGLPFRSRAPEINEEDWKCTTLTPGNLAADLARAKAQSLQQDEANTVILGCDQVANCAGQILGKPGTRERAVEQLRLLAGRTHELITSVCICHERRTWSHTDVTRLTMRDLSRAEMERYIALDEPLDCAGSYKLEQHGIVLFESIESADHTAIVGLPLIAVTTLLREIGFAIP